MRYVELIRGSRSSVLGFGCAPVLGAVGAKESRLAINTALDLGINHFDLARSYGYGEAESFIGRELSRRRDKVIIVSKFGIQTTAAARLLRPLKPLVRALRSCRRSRVDQNNLSEQLQSEIRGCTLEESLVRTPDSVIRNSRTARWDPFHKRMQFTPANMEASLHKSLRALRTDYLDLFLLHEPVEIVENADQLYETASRLKQQGKIRGWGAAYSWEDRVRVGALSIYADVCQFDCSPYSANYRDSVAERGPESNILFSPLRNRPENAQPSAILELLYQDFPKSVILCSMFSPDHIRQNAMAATLPGVPE